MESSTWNEEVCTLRLVATRNSADAFLGHERFSGHTSPRRRRTLPRQLSPSFGACKGNGPHALPLLQPGAAQSRRMAGKPALRPIISWHMCHCSAEGRAEAGPLRPQGRGGEACLGGGSTVPGPSHTAAVVTGHAPRPAGFSLRECGFPGPGALVSGSGFLFLEGLRPAPYREGAPGRGRQGGGVSPACREGAGLTSEGLPPRW